MRPFKDIFTHLFREVNFSFIQDDVADTFFLKTQRGNTFFYFKIFEPYQINKSRILVFEVPVIFQELLNRLEFRLNEGRILASVLQ